ncbi:hypothetical protein [Aestuariispira insulae]|nr:hypothetical protein [Aestuariispira insulae]
MSAQELVGRFRMEDGMLAPNDHLSLNQAASIGTVVRSLEQIMVRTARGRMVITTAKNSADKRPDATEPAHPG